MVAAFLLTLIQSGLTLLTPYLIKVAIDQYITPGDLPGLARISVILAIAFVLLFAVSSIQNYTLAWVGSACWQPCAEISSNIYSACH